MTYLRSGHNSAGSNPASPLVITATINIGERGIVIFTSTDGTGGVTSFSAGGVTWSQKSGNIFNNFNRINEEFWLSDAPLTSNITTVSVPFNGAPASVAGVAAAYDEPGSIGAIATPLSSHVANPSISLTTQDNNNIFIVAYGAGDGTAATAGTGNLRDQANVVSSADAHCSLVDNTSASPASVTCSITKAIADFSGVGVEFRSVSGFVPNKKILEEGSNRGLLLETGKYLFQ